MIFSKGVKSLLSGLNGESHSILSGVNDPLDFIEILKEVPRSQLTEKKNLIVLPDEDQCELFLSKFDLKHTYLPSYSNNPYSSLLPNSLISPKRIHFLHEASKETSSFNFFISHPSALFYRTLLPKDLKQQSLNFEFADTFFKNPTQSLLNLGYTPTPFVEKPGQFSDKGGIVDVFSPAHDHPHRIELFGNEIESLHKFSLTNQRTLHEAQNLYLTPATECFYNEFNKTNLIQKISNQNLVNSSWAKESLHKIRNLIPFDSKEFMIPFFWEQTTSAFKYFNPKETNLIIFDEDNLQKKWGLLVEQYEKEYEIFLKNTDRATLSPQELFDSQNFHSSFKKKLNICSVIVSDLSTFSSDLEQKEKQLTYSTMDISKTLRKIKASSHDWSEFSKSCINLFQGWIKAEYKIFISCPTKNSKLRTQAFLKELELKTIEYDPQVTTSESAIYLTENQIKKSTKYTDEQVIFIKQEDLLGKALKTSVKKKSHEEYFEKLDLLQISELKIEDLVVHINHGIGLFKGLKTIELQGVVSECIEIQYSGADKLFLPIHKINQIRKYSSNKNSRSLDKLGGAYWQKTKAKVKSKLKDIAEDLVQLYAKRKLIKRDTLDVFTNELTLFQSQFPFEETPDQLKAIHDIFDDFHKDYPMDRLICGDVGFGKTEVAMRAAFIALSEGKQVAVLAPTTILSLQHFNSFQKRFENWPFEVRVLNRFISKKDVKETLEKLKQGQVDLLVGTHRVLSKDVEFKDLSLLVVDEEQKFGVKQKETIKSLKSDIDILSMSATPIPRTLNMGFLGVRDLSLISTAPKNRLPIKTFISHFSPQVITQAVQSEISRGGQVYFVHNRVQSIHDVHNQLKELFPNLRIGLGHGQMPEKELEKIMIQFFNKELDILLSTTIIESGVDISTANTMIINNAQNFGLSQLYQLRGRVGRSERRAFCYLLIPPNRVLESDQKEKLKVLQDNTQLGSGLQIAHHDLELRGAGNLLGEAQSGHADEIGYEFYIELLEEAISESRGDSSSKKIDPEISVPLPALIPSKYINDLKTRLYYYRKLNKIKDEENLDAIENEMRDQFGKIPEEVIGLFFLSITKNICRALGVKDLKSGPKNIALQFTENPPINHERVMGLIQNKNSKYSFSGQQKFLIQKEKPQWDEIYNELVSLQKIIAI